MHPLLVPVWALVAGVILLALFVGLSIEAYAGAGLRDRLIAIGRANVAFVERAPPRVYYQPGSSVSLGARIWGSEGQDRVLLEGDVVLLGASRELVRVEAGGRTTKIQASEGASTQVVNLGAWDASGERLSGMTATFLGGQWVLPPTPLRSVGRDLLPGGSPNEGLTDGFWLGPDPDAGRVRRVSDRNMAAVRIRPTRKTPTLTLESWLPTAVRDGALISVRAVVRADPGSTVMLAIHDVVNATGQSETVVQRQEAGDEWLTLTVRRRLLYPSPADTLSVGLVDPGTSAWFEIQALDVLPGVIP